MTAFPYKTLNKHRPAVIPCLENMYSCKKKKRWHENVFISKTRNSTHHTNTFSLQYYSYWEATGNQSHLRERDVMLTEGGGGGCGVCQQRLISGLLGTRSWWKKPKLHHSSPALTQPWASPPPSKSPAARSHSGNNPQGTYNAPIDILLISTSPSRTAFQLLTHQTSLKCSLFYRIKRFVEVKENKHLHSITISQDFHQKQNNRKK